MAYAFTVELYRTPAACELITAFLERDDAIQPIDTFMWSVPVGGTVVLGHGKDVAVEWKRTANDTIVRTSRQHREVLRDPLLRPGRPADDGIIATPTVRGMFPPEPGSTERGDATFGAIRHPRSGQPLPDLAEATKRLNLAADRAMMRDQVIAVCDAQNAITLAQLQRRLDTRVPLFMAGLQAALDEGVIEVINDKDKLERTPGGARIRLTNRGASIKKIRDLKPFTRLSPAGRALKMVQLKKRIAAEPKGPKQIS